MGDTSKHLTSFKVENFKRFQLLELNELGQFNLIVGDNNVGKTSVLEALLVEEGPWFRLNNFLVTLHEKKVLHNLLYKDLELYVNRDRILDKSQYEMIFHLTHVDTSNKISYKFNLIEQKIRIESGNYKDETHLSQQASYNASLNIPFIPFNKGYDFDLVNYYSEKIQKNVGLKRKLIRAMKVMVPNFNNLELSSQYNQTYLIIEETNSNSTLPLAFYGEGTIKLFRILIEIIINNGRRLMIDEIDTGIHYSRFKEFWKVILITAKENDVQLFMTTHNEECIKYFIEVFNEMELSNFKSLAKSVSLIELPDKSVKAYTYTFEQLEANVHVGNEIRGGGR